MFRQTPDTVLSHSARHTAGSCVTPPEAFSDGPSIKKSSGISQCRRRDNPEKESYLAAGADASFWALLERASPFSLIFAIFSAAASAVALSFTVLSVADISFINASI